MAAPGDVRLATRISTAAPESDTDRGTMTHQVAHMCCPRCRVSLFVGATPAGPMHGCGTCGGVWLDSAASQRLTQALCDHTIALADQLAHAAPGAGHPAGAVCPVCQAQLAVTRVSRAQVEVDVCAAHGAWFDRNELQVVARAFAVDRAYSGGGGAAAGVGGVALAGAAGIATVGAVGAAAAMQDPALTERARRVVDEHGETAVEVGVEALDFVDAADVVEGAGVAAELGGGIAEGALELLGGIFSSFG